jgi:hypothetical protein
MTRRSVTANSVIQRMNHARKKLIKAPTPNTAIVV